MGSGCGVTVVSVNLIWSINTNQTYLIDRNDWKEDRHVRVNHSGGNGERTRMCMGEQGERRWRRDVGKCFLPTRYNI